MTVQEYQSLAMLTKNIDLTNDQQLLDGVTGLCTNVGLIAGMVKDKSTALKKDDLINELGNVVWYIALICESQHLSLNGVMVRNVDKLDRKVAGEIF